METLDQRQLRVSASDHGSAVGITAVFCLILAVLCVCGRVYTKVSALRKVAADDYMIFLALILFVGQTIAILIASRNGLGRHHETLDGFQDIVEKALYAAGVLTIPLLVLVKISISIFIRALGPMRDSSIVGIIFSFLVILWGIASEFVVAFGCKLPQPWKIVGNTCIDLLAFWNSVGGINITTDLILVLWPGLLIFRIHAGLGRRITIIALFASRLIVVACSSVLLVFANSEKDFKDKFADMWVSVLCAQITLATSIVTACIPYLIPFLESLESGLLRSDDPRSRGKARYHEHTSGNASDSSMQQSRSLNNSTPRSLPLQSVSGKTDTFVKARDIRWADGQSSSSSTRVIQCEQSWAVGYQSRNVSEDSEIVL